MNEWQSLRAEDSVSQPGSNIVCVLSCPEAEVFQRKLDETTRLLRELQEAQNERLSARPPPNTICLLGPSYREIHLGTLTQGTRAVTPLRSHAEEHGQMTFCIYVSS